MRPRKQNRGTKNIIGANVEKMRKLHNLKQKELLAKLQVNGIDISASGLSKLEGGLRLVTDYELIAIAKALNVSVEELLGK